MMLPNKIFAAREPEMVSLYAVPKEEPTPEFSYSELFLKILSFVIIPLVLLVGAIVFYKKSKMKNIAKILIIIAVAIIATLSIIYVTLIYHNYCFNSIFSKGKAPVLIIQRKKLQYYWSFTCNSCIDSGAFSLLNVK